MKTNYLKQTLLFIVVIAIILGGVFYATKFVDYQPVENNQINTDNQESYTVSLSVEDVYTNESVSITGRTTLLEMLERLNQNDTKLQLVTKDFKDMGILVESMGEKTNGTDSKYWQYKVNNVSPMVGADTYILKAGDEVKWEFTSSEF